MTFGKLCTPQITSSIQTLITELFIIYLCTIKNKTFTHQYNTNTQRYGSSQKNIYTDTLGEPQLQLNKMLIFVLY